MFDKMPDKEVDRLGSCLRGIVERVNTGADPEQEMVKEAIEKDLSLNKVARLCEAYNKAISVKEICSRPIEKKAEDIGLVDFQKVANSILGISKESSTPYSELPNLSTVDLDSLREKRNIELIQKAAAEEKPVTVKPSWEAEWTRNKKAEQAKEAHERNAEMRKKQDINELEDMVRNFSYEVSRKPEFLNKYASDIKERHGERGAKLIKIAAALSRAPYDEKDKPGSKMPVPGPLGKMVEEIMEKKAHVEKQAGPLTIPALMAPSIISQLGANLPKDDINLSPTGRKYRKIDSKLSADLARAEKTDHLITLYESDPTFHGLPLETVAEAFDFATEQLPHMHPLRDRDTFITVMKRKLVSSPDMYELAQLRSLDKDVVDSMEKDEKTKLDVAAVRRAHLDFSKGSVPSISPDESFASTLTKGTGAIGDIARASSKAVIGLPDDVVKAFKGDK